MKWSDLPLRPNDRLLRQFAVLWTVFFLGVAAWQYGFHDRTTLAGCVAAAALVVGLPGMAYPAWVRPIFVGWTIATFPIGWVVSHLVLGTFFYGLMTPVALFFRLIGRDELKLRAPAGATTYWTRKPKVSDPGRYFQQF